MPKGQTHATEQISKALRMVDEGMGDVCRLLGIVEKAFHRWGEKYALMETGVAKRLRKLEDQNARLKKLLAEQALQHEAPEDVSTRLVG